MITPEQCRAARGLLGWKQQDLAEHAELGIVTVRKFERGERDSYRSSIKLIVQAFEAAGVEFITENGGGEGVRFRQPRAGR